MEEAQIISMLRLSVCLCVCMAEALQTQTESLEKSRLKQLRILAARRSTGETPSQAQSTQQVSLLSVSLHIEYAIEHFLCTNTTKTYNYWQTGILVSSCFLTC